MRALMLVPLLLLAPRFMKAAGPRRESEKNLPSENLSASAVRVVVKATIATG